MLIKLVILYILIQTILGVAAICLSFLGYKQNQAFYNLSAERDKYFRWRDKIQNQYLAALFEVRSLLVNPNNNVQDILKVIDKVLDNDNK